jgi:hypothetical protein
MTRWNVTSVFALVLAGCAGAAPDGAEPVEEPVFTETMVKLHDDAAPEISVVRLPTVYQTDETGVAVARAGITGYSPCRAILCSEQARTCPLIVADYDGNVACFVGTGTIALSSVPRGAGGNWQFAVASYRAESLNGYFTGYSFVPGHFGTCHEYFSGWTVPVPGTCSGNSTYVTQTP